MVTKPTKVVKRVAIYYENRLGRNDGAPLYTNSNLQLIPGLEIHHLTSRTSPKKLGLGKFDLHIWVDWGEDGLTEILPYEPISMKGLHPSVYWTCDTHLGYEYRLKKAKEFDYVFCTHKEGRDKFVKDGIKNPVWLPCAVDPRYYPNKPEAIKKYDIGFIGFVTFEKRAIMLDKMLKEFPNFFYGQRFFMEAAEIYRKSKIVFNTAADRDINMRVFESLATGSFLLTEYVPTLPRLFKNKKHLVWYKSMDEAIKLAKYYLKHDNEREKIAKAGMEEVFKKHTYMKRIEKMFKTINF